ncbi:MAG: 2-phospho-L-lactate transferase [Alphaproteobacteria bacterium]|nr:2-phospho-L-lactate transferase [Alphaproteobacteria bacterium]
MSVLALSGGIGGAKLAAGLCRVLPPGELTVVANTGDDFEHLGLSISPDIDTLLYTLAGIDNADHGWGRREETWTFMGALETLGGETWFKLGDGDLATHVERTRRLAAGEPLSRITDDFRRRLGIPAQLVPMTDDRVRTRLRTEAGWLDFQDYFVRRRSSPVVREIVYAGAAEARASREFLAALADHTLSRIVICPSNPFLSIDPILSLPGVREALRCTQAPVVAVSPIIGGQAVKGPTAKIMTELGLPVSPAAVARRYADFLDIYVADEADADEVADLAVPVRLTRTLMLTPEDRQTLATAVLAAPGRGL